MVKDWISQSEHDRIAEKAMMWERARQRWLAERDADKAELCRTQGEGWLFHLHTWDPSRPLGQWTQPKRVISDEEAQSIEDAEALAKLRKKVERTPYRPVYRGGLPTLGKHR
ncbi:hypothetical protein ACIOKD_35500 [Streptomyces sp. NPDC087844]|uniref:hypothetical protein n=1 Tax=Streptomyces sp. NPDC087844 TaxID=3365805 RepID=UPI003814BB20